jgi:hypothetical protein
MKTARHEELQPQQTECVMISISTTSHKHTYTKHRGGGKTTTRKAGKTEFFVVVVVVFFQKKMIQFSFLLLFI